MTAKMILIMCTVCLFSLCHEPRGKALFRVILSVLSSVSVYYSQRQVYTITMRCVTVNAKRVTNRFMFSSAAFLL